MNLFHVVSLHSDFLELDAAAGGQVRFWNNNPFGLLNTSFNELASSIPFSSLTPVPSLSPSGWLSSSSGTLPLFIQKTLNFFDQLHPVLFDHNRMRALGQDHLAFVGRIDKLAEHFLSHVEWRVLIPFSYYQ